MKQAYLRTDKVRVTDPVDPEIVVFCTWGKSIFKIINFNG